jgi:hypothetical protein
MASPAVSARTGFRELWRRPAYRGFVLTVSLSRTSSAMFNTAGVLLILEGPAYSGTIALRQRHSPPEARAQVLTTVSGITGLALSAGAVAGGAIHDPLGLILLFTAVNLVAAVSAAVLARGADDPAT